MSNAYTDDAVEALLDAALSADTVIRDTVTRLAWHADHDIRGIPLDLFAVGRILDMAVDCLGRGIDKVAAQNFAKAVSIRKGDGMGTGGAKRRRKGKK